MSKTKTKKITVPYKAQTFTDNQSFFVRHLYPLVIFIVSFIAFANGISNDYNLDDELVTQNHRLTSKGVAAIGDIFTEPYYKDEMGYQYEYRPIVLVFFAIEHEFFGDNPHVSHFFNVLFYSFLCVFLFFVIRKLLGEEYELLSWAATLLFAVHPAHTEIVDSIKNRDEILALAGALAALYFAIKFIETKKWYLLLVILVTYLFALLSKLTITSFAIFIPLALILFKNARLREILWVSLMLLIPLSVLINLGSLQTRIFFVLGIFAVNTSFYFLKNFSFTKENILVLFSELKNNFEDYNTGFSFKKLWGKTSLTTSIFIIALLVGSAFFFVSENMLAFRIALFLVLVLWLISNWEWKVVFATTLLFPVFLITHYLLYLPDTFLISLIALPLIILSFRTRRTFSLLLWSSAIITWLYTIAASLKPTESVFILIFLLTFLYPKTNKYKRWVLGFSGVVFAITCYSAFQKGSLLYISWGLPVLVIAYYSMQNTKAGKYLLILPITVFILIIMFPVDSTDGLRRLKSKQDINLANKISKIKAPDVIEGAYRPIGFAEVPITYQTPFADKLGTSMDIAGKYLKLIIIPYPLSFYYGYKYIDVLNFWKPYPIIVFIIYTALGLASLYFYRKKPIISFGILLYLVSIAAVLPVFSLLPGMMADRFLFIPSLGLALIITFVLFEIWKAFAAKEIKAFPSELKISLGIILLLYTGATIARTRNWKDRVTLFSHDIKHLENSAQAHNLLGVHLGIKANSYRGEEQRKLREESAHHFKRALEIYPDFMNPSFDLGRTYASLGKPNEAISAFHNTIRIKPRFTEAYLNIALLCESYGRYEEAIPYYERIIAINPGRSVAYANLSAIYFRQNKFEQALEISQRAIKAMPQNYIPYVNSAKIFMKLLKRDSAIVYFEKAYQLNNNDPQIVKALYALYSEKQNMEKMSFYAGRIQAVQAPGLPTVTNGNVIMPAIIQPSKP